MLNKGNKIHNFILLTFVIPFYYGSGTAINYGSGSATMLSPEPNVWRCLNAVIAAVNQSLETSLLSDRDNIEDFKAKRSTVHSVGWRQPFPFLY
jgi:hypothetical protein